MPPREPPGSDPLPEPEERLTPQQESQVRRFLSRLLLLPPLGLALWAVAISLGATGPASLLSLAISFFAVLSVGERRPLMGGGLVMASALVEWSVTQAWPGLWPLPHPLGALLIPTFVLIGLELRSPQAISEDITDSAYQGPAYIWRLVVLALPVMLIAFFGMHWAL